MRVVCTRFGFTTTVGIISGNPKHDRRTAAIIDAVKSQSKEPIEFIGVIGDQYAKKLTKQYASSSIGDKNQIVITRNYDEVIQDSIINPYRTITQYKNYQLVKTLKNQQFFEELYSKGSPAVITVGNFSIIGRVFEALNKFYESKGAQKPLRLGFDLLNADRKIQNEKVFDFLYHYLPRSPTPVTRYTFPSMCIGYEGLFKAFRFLTKYQTEGKSFKHEEFSIEVDDLVRKARAQYRKNKGFTEDQYLILLAPGNQQSEIKMSFSKFASALSGFSTHDKIKSINKDFFKVLVLVPEDKKIAESIKSRAASLGTQYNVTIVEQSDKYGAMCAADYAVLHNGQITVQAAACQLPAIVINSMSNFNAYISYLYNGHQSPLNISTNYHAYEQLLGSLSIVPLKITTSMVEHFERPKLRYNYIKLYREEIHKMLMMNGRNKDLDLSKTGVEAAAADILKKIQLRKKLTNEKPLNFYERKQKLELA